MEVGGGGRFALECWPGSQEGIWGGSLPLGRTQARGPECAIGAALPALVLPFAHARATGLQSWEDLQSCLSRARQPSWLSEDCLCSCS
jgi:hypothetical protein